MEKIREKTICVLSDEDLVLLGYDPKTFSDEEFEQIGKCIQESLDDTFSEMTKDAVVFTK